MLQVGQEPKLVDEEVDAALIGGAAQGLLYRQVDEQPVYRRQHGADAQVVLHEDDPAPLPPHQLAHGQIALFAEVAHKDLPHHLLQLGHYAQSLARLLVLDVGGHGLQVLVGLEDALHGGHGEGVEQGAQGLVVAGSRELVGPDHVEQQGGEQVFGRVGEKGLGGVGELLGEEALGDLQNVLLHPVVDAHLPEQVPVVRAAAAGGPAVVADDHVPGLVELPVEVALGVEDDDHVPVGQAAAHAADEKVEGVGLARADAAQQQHVPGEHLLPHRDAHGLPQGVVAHEEEVGFAVLVLAGVKQPVAGEYLL